MRILSDRFLRRSPREVYWSATRLGNELVQLHTHGSTRFRPHARRDLARYILGTVRPIDGETEARARAAALWLLRAQAATPDHGVSLGYFPRDRGRSRWRPSYPETTGYIITSLLLFSERFGDSTFQDAALRMARWEIEIQMPSGAVQGGPICPPERQTPAAFNTGMVLDGWCSAYERENSEDILAAARRAANFLVADLDEHGYYRTNGAFVSAGEIKTYTCLCAWAIYRFGNLVDEPKYRSAAIRSIEAALKQQQPERLVRSQLPRALRCPAHPYDRLRAAGHSRSRPSGSAGGFHRGRAPNSASHRRTSPRKWLPTRDLLRRLGACFIFVVPDRVGPTRSRRLSSLRVQWRTVASHTGRQADKFPQAAAGN